MRLSKKITMPTEEILDLAERHFLKGGLKVTERTTNRICLENDLGFVAVQLRTMTTGELDIITEGFDERAKDFIRMVSNMKFKERREPIGKSPVSEGQIMKVRIVDVGKQGDGIARVEGLIIFVREGKVGEELEVKVTKVSKTAAFAEPTIKE